MPFITQDLLRKKAEHNEGCLTTLEEVSDHYLLIVIYNYMCIDFFALTEY